MTDPNPPQTDLCYPVLTPIKFRGVIIKPPCLLQLSEDEAKPMIDAGLLDPNGDLPLDEAAAALVVKATEPNTTTTATTKANPGGGAPPPGTARKRAVVKKTVKKS